MHRAEKDPQTKHARRRCVPKPAKELVRFLIRASQTLIGILREKQSASHTYALSRSRKHRAVNVEGVATPAQGDARISLVLLV